MEKLLINNKNIEQIANYLFYYEKIFKDCIVKSDNYGPIMTFGITESKDITLDKDNNLLNFKHEIAEVIHQYDRKHGLMLKVMNKYCTEQLIFNKFRNESNNKIPSEKIQKIKEDYKNRLMTF